MQTLRVVDYDDLDVCTRMRSSKLLIFSHVAELEMRRVEV
jgi:hypothetical protein